MTTVCALWRMSVCLCVCACVDCVCYAGKLGQSPGMDTRRFEELGASKHLKQHETIMDLGSLVSRESDAHAYRPLLPLCLSTPLYSTLPCVTIVDQSDTISRLATSLTDCPSIWLWRHAYNMRRQARVCTACDEAAGRWMGARDPRHRRRRAATGADTDY